MKTLSIDIETQQHSFKIRCALCETNVVSSLATAWTRPGTGG